MYIQFTQYNFSSRFFSISQYGIRANFYFHLVSFSPQQEFLFPSLKSKVFFFFEPLSMASSDQTSVTIAIDESHPFFLHHTESPSAILVSQPLIGGDNYLTWALSMERALRIKNKFWLINGFASLTPTMEKVPLLVQSWSRCNENVVSWIINCISPKIATSMVYCKTAKEVWKKLQDMFSQGNGPRVYQLQKILPIFSKGSFLWAITSLTSQFCGMRYIISIHFLFVYVESVYVMWMTKFPLFITEKQLCNF